MLDIVEFEKVFYLYSLKEPKYLKSIKPEFFDNQELGLMFEVSKAFQERFKESPSKDQIKLLTKQDKFKDRLSESLIDLVFHQRFPFRFFQLNL